MASHRSQRVAERIQQEVTEIVSRGVRDPRVGFVTITGVDMSSDLSLAKIFYTVIGSDAERKETEAGLKKAAPYIRRELAPRIQMRHVPELQFHFDRSLEQGNRIEAILRTLNQERTDDSGDTEED